MSTSVFAHFCTNANKKEGAGSVGVYNVDTETYESISQPNGGFVTFTDGVNSYDIFMHQTLPEGALAAGPGGDDQCDGQGIDSVLACLGYPSGSGSV